MAPIRETGEAARRAKEEEWAIQNLDDPSLFHGI